MYTVQNYIHQWSWLLLIIFCVIGLFFPIIGITALFCMMAPVIVAFFKGRRWCGVYCPRGSFNDIILTKYTLKGQVPALFYKNKIKLLFLSILMGAFMTQIILAWGNLVAIGQVFVRMIIMTTILAIILGLRYNPRAWCLICPMGTMAHYVAKMKAIEARIRHVAFDQSKCTHCKVCSRVCPVSIDVYSYRERGKVADANCLKCMNCIKKCPKKSLHYPDIN